MWTRTRARGPIRGTRVATYGAGENPAKEDENETVFILMFWEFLIV